MSDADVLRCEPRDRVGKGASRAVRRQDRVPAVIYGDGQTPESISIDMPQLVRVLNRGRFLSKIFTIEVGSSKTRVIPKAIQRHPVTELPEHLDFLRVAKDAKVPVNVPVHFINEEKSQGLKRGGVLNVVRHEVELLAPIDSIPDFVEADLSGFDINDTVHISNIPLPAGCTPTITDRDFTVATIAAPSGGVGDDEDGGEEGAGEGDGEEKSED